MKNLKEKIFLFLVFLMPLAFDYWGYDIFEVPKNIIFKIGLAILIMVLIGEFIKSRKIKIKSSFGIEVSVILLLLVLFISLIFSFRPHVSFWGTFFRQGGVLNYLLYIALFYVGLQFLDDKKGKIKFFKVLSTSGFLVSIYAILQKFGIDPFNFSQIAAFDHRSSSFLGNPTMLGAFLIFPFWSEIILFKRNKKVPLKIKNIVFLLLIVVALIFSENRATILALALTAGLLALVKFRENKKILVSIITIGIIGLAGLTFFFSQNPRSLNARLEIWESSAQIVKQSPILGYGAESFEYMFEENMTPEYFKYEYFASTADRPHNEFLEMWIHFGLPGLLFYTFLLVAVLKKFLTTKNLAIQLSATAVLSLFVTNFFSFSLVTQSFFLSLFLAITFSENLQETKFKLNLGTKILSLFIIVLALANIYLGINIQKANRNISNGAISTAFGLTETSKTATEKALNTFPKYKEMYSLAFDNYFNLINEDTDQEFVDRTIELNHEYTLLSGGDLQSILDQAQIHELHGQYKEAEELYRIAIEQKGEHPIAYSYLGNMYFVQDEIEKAAEAYDKLTQLIYRKWNIGPSLLPTLDNMIKVYEELGQEEKIKRIKSIFY